MRVRPLDDGMSAMEFVALSRCMWLEMDVALARYVRGMR